MYVPQRRDRTSQDVPNARNLQGPLFQELLDVRVVVFVDKADVKLSIQKDFDVQKLHDVGVALRHDVSHHFSHGQQFHRLKQIHRNFLALQIPPYTTAKLPVPNTFVRSTWS